jgi:mRNA interferase YafQ
MLDFKTSVKFRKDLKRMEKQGKDLSLMDEVIGKLQTGKPLEAKYRDHQLKGKYAGHRECHVAPDWLLIYIVNNKKLILTATDTGSHSELF